jgi:hypothetical protein
MFPASKAEFDMAEVDIRTWPRASDQRPLCESSGRAGGVRGERRACILSSVVAR